MSVTVWSWVQGQVVWYRNEDKVVMDLVEEEKECFYSTRAVIWIRRPTLRLDKKSLSCGPPVHYNFKNNMKINIKLSLNTNYIQ